MNIALQKIFYQLIGKTNLQDVRLETLFELADSHPYFSPAQLFLSIKMQEEKHHNYQKQLQKVALYFNNTHWLYHQLTPKPEYIQFIGQENEDIIEPILHQVIEEEINNHAQPKTEVFENIPTVENVTKILEEIGTTETATTEPEQQETPISTNIQEEQQLGITSVALEEAEKENSPYTEQFIQTNTPFTAPTTQDIQEEETNEASINDTNIENKLSDIIKKQLEAFNEPVADNTNLPIENNPQHTVDYFASQGIKAEVEFNAQDKLSSQLRKFTDWLKHIKTQSVENKDDLGTDPELENAIQEIAKNSNVTREIVTETMAEVLEKQGKKDKAIQLYIKLSFLNPDKSTYFATKIQHLKGI
ncbi:MAG: hypothetical protein KF781_11550 [Chitinophagaceae bacterium]|nr:hypothetical protein [Chitinophagaceae bacterium]MCW5905826.1 hypothetical protein [Chitinophagaceae bacterium]